MSEREYVLANGPRLATPEGPGRQTLGVGLSLLAAYAAGEAYSIYAIFVVHSLKPVTAYLSEHDSFRRAVSGKYVEVFNPDGLILTLVMSLIVFVSVWCLLGSVAQTLSSQAYQDPQRPGGGYRLLEYISARNREPRSNLIVS